MSESVWERRASFLMKLGVTLGLPALGVAGALNFLGHEHASMLVFPLVPAFYGISVVGMIIMIWTMK